MKKYLLAIVVFIFGICFLASCDNNSSVNENGKMKSFVSEYDSKITYTIKLGDKTYNYQYVYDLRIQIKPKSSKNSNNYTIKISIFDGEADSFSEEIITRFYSLNKSSNIDCKITNVYTNNQLFAYSSVTKVVDSAESDYTKDFFNEKIISFDSNGGTEYSSRKVSSIDCTLPFPTKTGYSFEGWYTDNTYQKKINYYKDLQNYMTLYAKWKIIEYTINYQISDDVTNDNISNYNIETEVVTLNEPTRTGYTFKGWYDKKDFSGDPITKIYKGSWGSFTLYPKWEANTYDVELIFNDDVTENTIVKQTYGNSYSNLPIPEREGFIFEGWYLDENDYSSLVDKVLVAENHILYAKWVEGTNGLTYAKTSKGWVITGCTNTTTSTLKIPESIAGVDVVSIKDNAFKNMNNVTKIEIPNTVTSIGNGAFSGMNKITEVVIPDSVTSMGYDVFYNCSSIESIVLPYLPTTSNGTELGYIFGRDDTNSDLYQNQVRYYVPKSLTKVTITKATAIGGYAFHNLSNVVELTIPNTVTSIGTHAFCGMNKITKINIPEGVTSIGSGAFYNCSNITEITIPSGVTEIKLSTFRGLSKISEIVIPEGVTSIGDYAFEGCSGIKRVFYCGTEQNWNNISIASNNDSLNATIKLYYSENEPSEAGYYWHYDNENPTEWFSIVSYKVEHYLQDIDDNYSDTPYQIDDLVGFANTSAIIETKSYDGFISPSTTHVNIEPTGETIIKLYYVRNTYSVVLLKNIENAGNVIGSGDYKYEKEVCVSITTNPGYTFLGWYNGKEELTKENMYSFGVGANSIIYTAHWIPNDDTSYKVEHYLQNINDEKYPSLPFETDNLIGTTDTLTNGSVNTYEGFTSPEIIQVTISGDGNTVIKLYYTRNSYTVTLSKNNEKAGVINGGGTYKYGKEITITATTYEGYSFDCWYYDDNNKITSDSYTFKIPFNDISFVAKWNTNTYEVNYIANGEIVKTSIATYDSDYSFEFVTLSGKYEAIQWVCSNLSDVQFGNKFIWKYTSNYTFVATTADTSTDFSFTIYSGSNANLTRYNSSSKNVIIADYIKKNGNYYRIRQIADYLLENNKNIESVYISSSLYAISTSAFSGCTSLSKVTFAENSSLIQIGSNAFKESAIENIIIPNNVNYIADSAFSGCTYLSEISLDNTLQAYGENIFECCTKLFKVFYRGSIDDWNSLISNNSVDNPLPPTAKLYVLENGEYVEVNNE